MRFRSSTHARRPLRPRRPGAAALVALLLGSLLVTAPAPGGASSVAPTSRATCISGAPAPHRSGALRAASTLHSAVNARGSRCAAAIRDLHLQSIAGGTLAAVESTHVQPAAHAARTYRNPLTPRAPAINRSTQVSADQDLVWYVADGSPLNGTQFGQQGDQAAAADYDGDGKADIAVFRPADGTWHVRQSSDARYVPRGAFGQAGDLAAPGDYDGDHRADLAVFRPSNGTWYIARSTGGSTTVRFGQPGDLPAPGDYDNDGRTDVAVFRPGDGVWHVLRSSDGQYQVKGSFGQAGDLPAAGDYDQHGRVQLAAVRLAARAPVPLADLLVCEGSPVPNGYVLVDVTYVIGGCGASPASRTPNQPMYRSYLSVPAGSGMDVCAQAVTPAGWVIQSYSVRLAACGAGAATSPPNIRFIRRVAPEPLTDLVVCPGSPTLTGYILVDIRYEIGGCGDSPTGRTPNQPIYRYYLAVPVGSGMDVCVQAPTPAGWVIQSSRVQLGACGAGTGSTGPTIKFIRRAS